MAKTFEEAIQAFLKASDPETAAKLIKENLAVVNERLAKGPPSAAEAALMLEAVDHGNKLLGGNFLKAFSERFGPWVARVSSGASDPTVQPEGAGPAGPKPKPGSRKRNGKETPMARTDKEVDAILEAEDAIEIAKSARAVADADVLVAEAQADLTAATTSAERKAAREALKKARKARREASSEHTELTDSGGYEPKAKKSWFERVF